MRAAEQNIKELKLGTFNYIDDVLYTFQERMSNLNESYAQRILDDINDMFEKIDTTISSNRDEIKDLSYRTETDIN